MTVFINADILLAVLAHLDTRDLARFGSTSKHYRTCTHKEIRRRIRDILSSHMPRSEMQRFLAILDDTGSVVSGSTALAIVCWNSRRDWRQWAWARDLDIYVARGRVQPLMDFFVSLGYSPKFSSVSRRSPYTRTNGVRSVTTLMLLPPRIPLAPISLDIVESTRLSAMWPLAHFWGTAVSNFFSARSLVSAYPEETLKGTCVVNPDACVYPNVLAKYRARGFNIVVNKRTIVYVLPSSNASACLTNCSGNG